MGSFREHGLMLYLCPELQIAHVKLQADKELGRSYAGLLAFTEGLHTLGYLEKADYERLREKYSQGLEKEQPLTFEQLQKQKEIDKMAKKFSMVLDQWHMHPDSKWRDYWLREAEAWKDKVPNAKLVLALQGELTE
jgi:hypothetical protein